MSNNIIFYMVTVHATGSKIVASQKQYIPNLTSLLVDIAMDIKYFLFSLM